MIIDGIKCVFNETQIDYNDIYFTGRDMYICLEDEIAKTQYDIHHRRLRQTPQEILR